MKKKIYTRTVSVVLTEEIFKSINKIKDRGDIGISDYIREEMAPDAVFNGEERSWSKVNACKKGKMIFCWQKKDESHLCRLVLYWSPSFKIWSRRVAITTKTL
jgi:hypothetical protein